MMDPIIHLGPLSIRWYGIILAAAILLSYYVTRKNSWKFGISTKDVDDFSFWLVLTGVIGARAYFVLFSWDYYTGNPAEIFQIWRGGLSIYGAILAGLLFCFFYTRHKPYSIWRLLDLLALGIPLGQALGRFGNFVNSEAFGYPTNLPWGIYVPSAM